MTKLLKPIQRLNATLTYLTKKVAFNSGNNN